MSADGEPRWDNASEFELNKILDEIAREMAELHRVGNDLFMRDPLRDEYCVVTTARVKHEFIRLHPGQYLAHAHTFAKRWADLTLGDALTIDIPARELLVRYGTNGRLYGQQPGFSGLGSLTNVKPQMVHAGGPIDVDELLWYDASSAYAATNMRGTGYRVWRDILPLMFAAYTNIAPDAVGIIRDYIDIDTGVTVIGSFYSGRGYVDPQVCTSTVRHIYLPDCPIGC